MDPVIRKPAGICRATPGASSSPGALSPPAEHLCTREHSRLREHHRRSEPSLPGVLSTPVSPGIISLPGVLLPPGKFSLLDALSTSAEPADVRCPESGARDHGPGITFVVSRDALRPDDRRQGLRAITDLDDVLPFFALKRGRVWLRAPGA